MITAGPVTVGTLRPEDLIPAFLSALDTAIEAATFRPGADHPARVARIGQVQDELGALERRTEQENYYDDNSEQVEQDVDRLRELLDEFAKLNGYDFGPLEGDPTQYGFWPRKGKVRVRIDFEFAVDPREHGFETLQELIDDELDGGLLANHVCSELFWEEIRNAGAEETEPLIELVEDVDGTRSEVAEED